MDLRIIPADLKYIEEFHSALDFVAREEKYILMLQAPPLESVKDFVAKNIEKKVPQVFALVDDKLVGWADVSPFIRETINHRGQLGMGILPSYRGKGIGTLLLKEVLKLSKERGLEKVELEVYKSNSAAFALYKKLGFEEQGILKKGRKLRGQYEDMVLMGLFL
ncbi:MAG: GNAT family N-acetyltransferase [Bacteriovoracaceae bacterium]